MTQVNHMQAEQDPQGLLTPYLVRALRGEADGLDLSDLARYLEDRVGNLSRVALGQPQRPLVLGKAERQTTIQ